MVASAIAGGLSNNSFCNPDKGTLKSVSRTLALFGQWKVIAPPVYHKHSHSPVIPILRPTSPPKITTTSHDNTRKRIIAYRTHTPETGLIILQGKAYHTTILGCYVTFFVIFPFYSMECDGEAWSDHNVDSHNDLNESVAMLNEDPRCRYEL